MPRFRTPDWQGAMCTGMWQIAYHLDAGRDLIFFGGASPRQQSAPHCEWGLAILRGKVRDTDSERQLMSNPSFARQVKTCSVDGSEFIVVTEGAIDGTVDLAREILLARGGRATA